MIRPLPHYRRDAFVTGLKALGYDVGPHSVPRAREDLLIIWNRYGQYELQASRWEADGGTVVVAENGYVGDDYAGHQLYALSIHGHNGSGWFYEGGWNRFNGLKIDLKPWQNSSGYYLICGQRGIGSKQMASPANWHTATQHKFWGHDTKVRSHPGNQAPTTPLSDDLNGAKACVIWSSSAGVKSLIAGVPVVFDAPHWICAGAAVSMTDFLRHGKLLQDDELRVLALKRMAWAQWTVDEIARGIPFAFMRDSLGQAQW